MASKTLFFVLLAIHIAQSRYMRVPYEYATAVYAKYGATVGSVKQIIDDPTLPENFDGRIQWPGCIHAVLDQGDCGSCWAFAASETLSDRFCIYSKGSVNVTLSPQNLLSCEELNLGCTMGSLPMWAWKYLKEYGITTLECTPYVDGNGGSDPACNDTCTDGTPGKLYQASNYSQAGDLWEPSKHVQAIMKAVLQGPVDATFSIYSDFDNYSGGVYQYTHGDFEGLHSVKVIGFGVENGTDYWLVQNSWGTDWGIDGYFKILRGVDECEFESLMYTGFPLL
eukprot:TRINITY_DN11885_c0_g1_i1.p1 TRINITY_DN11885_c0_g1~~TRINITY_DN11885_c0_g1_i1.p1  ORF type:complete len:294 (-),score=16.88 TRINITY_DN11885_c0_g1_i1:41-883(-)